MNVVAPNIGLSIIKDYEIVEKKTVKTPDTLKGIVKCNNPTPLREIQPDGSRHPFDQFIVAKTPAGRWGDPEDMVGPCVFLASHASDFVNGQILYADGGILAYIGRQPK